MDRRDVLRLYAHEMHPALTQLVLVSPAAEGVMWFEPSRVEVQHHPSCSDRGTTNERSIVRGISLTRKAMQEEESSGCLRLLIFRAWASVHTERERGESPSGPKIFGPASGLLTEIG